MKTQSPVVGHTLIMLKAAAVRRVVGTRMWRRMRIKKRLMRWMQTRL
jgi:hypothetical protein